MATIVYLQRLKQSLPADAKGLPCTRHRIFLACLIISSKNFNDSSPKNKHWAQYTDGLFAKDDVNLMERQLLLLLDWNTTIDTQELARVWKRFLDPIKTDLSKSLNMRKNLSKGMLACSTQTIINSASNQSSNTSIHSRSSSLSSSVSSLSLHSRSSSLSSVSSLSSDSNDTYTLQKTLDSLNDNTVLSNYLKSVAMKEEQELNDLLRHYHYNA